MTSLHGQAVPAIYAGGHGIAVDLGESGERAGFDGVVICVGAANRALAAALGDRVNKYPVKGYSITVHLNDANSQSAAPSFSLRDDATKLATAAPGERPARA